MSLLIKLKNIKWDPIFTREGFPYFIASLSFDGYLNDMRKNIGWAYRDQALLSQKNILTVFGSQRDIQSFKSFSQKKDKSFFLQVNDKILTELKKAKQGVNEANRLLNKAELTGNELVEIIKIFYKSYRGLYSVYRFSTLVDQHYQGCFKNSIIKKFAKAKDLCGRFFTETDKTTLELIKDRISKILKLDRNLALYLNAQEIISSLRSQKLKIDPKELKTRFNFYIFMAVDSKTYLFTGNQAKEIHSKMNFLDHKVKNPKIINGSTAFRGLIKGKVKLIHSVKELRGIFKSAVLVTPMTTISYIPFLKKFSAIITDEGGLTCHAAIIARELKIPCIVGTKIATKIFKDGDRVEVDANKGVVRKL